MPASCQGTGCHSHQGSQVGVQAGELNDSLDPSGGGGHPGLASASVPHLSHPSSPPKGAPNYITCLTFQKPQLSPRVISLGPHSQRRAPVTLERQGKQEAS